MSFFFLMIFERQIVDASCAFDDDDQYQLTITQRDKTKLNMFYLEKEVFHLIWLRRNSSFMKTEQRAKLEPKEPN